MIINLLEANRDWDAFETASSDDEDNDDIPDYWEMFHFGSLDHDANYVAVPGGLTLAEAYTNATDPKDVDSDGDGWTNAQEIAWGWDPNYDQSRDDPKYGPDGDYDGDGSNNRTEAANSTSLTDALDAPPPGPSYAVIDLGEVRADHVNVDTPDVVASNGHVLFIGKEKVSDNAPPRVWTITGGLQNLPMPSGNVLEFQGIDMNDSGKIVGMVNKEYNHKVETSVAGQIVGTDISKFPEHYPIIWKYAEGAYSVASIPWAETLASSTYQTLECASGPSAENYDHTVDAHKKGAVPVKIHDDGHMLLLTTKNITYQSKVEKPQANPCDWGGIVESYSVDYAMPIIAYGTEEEGSGITAIVEPTYDIIDLSTPEILYGYLEIAGPRDFYDISVYKKPVFTETFDFTASSSNYVAFHKTAEQEDGSNQTTYELVNYAGTSVYATSRRIIEVNNDAMVIMEDGSILDTTLTPAQTITLGNTNPHGLILNSDDDGLHTIIESSSDKIWIRSSQINPETNAVEPASELGFTVYFMEDLVPKGSDPAVPLWGEFRLTDVANNGMICGTAFNKEGEKRAVLLLKVELENLREEIITDAFEVSNKVTNQNLDVQASSVGDPRTYRVKLPVDLGSSAKIRFDLYDEDGASVDRNETEEPENGELQISEKTENAETFYATDNFRFVTWDTDDAHAGNQTIKVKLGDTVRMNLVVNGNDLTYFELPIGLPPSESSVKAIRTVDTRFVKLDYGNVASEASLGTLIERMDKVFAQGAVRFNKIDETTRGPVKNMISIEGNAASTGALLLLVETTQENGSKIGYQIDVNIGAGIPSAVAQAIASAINAQVESEVATSHSTYPRSFGSSSSLPNAIAHVVIDQGKEVIYSLAVIDEQIPGTNVFVPSTDLSNGDANNLHAVALLGLNYGDYDSNTLDVFITNEVSAAGSGARGIALPHYYTSSSSPIVGGFCIRLSASKDNDYDPLIAPHEAGHILLDESHPSIPNNLMDGPHLPTADLITATKRITDGQIEDLRSTLSPATGMLQAK